MLFGVTYLSVLLFALVPYVFGRFKTRNFAFSLATGIVLAVLGAIFSVSQLLWTDLSVLVVGLAGGALLGRVVAPRSPRLLVILVMLSILDVAQFLIFSGPAPSTSGVQSGPSPLAYLNFTIPPPVGRFNLGIFDIIVVVWISEHWRRREGLILVAEVPGLSGFALANFFIAITSTSDGLPLIPFFLTGFLISEGLQRLIGSRKWGQWSS